MPPGLDDNSIVRKAKMKDGSETTRSSTGRRPLASNRRLVLLFFSQSLGMMARAAYFVALPLFVLERTGSAFSMGISLFLGYAPFTLAGPFAGSVVDRFSRRDLIVATNLLYGAALLVLPFMHAQYLIYITAFTASVFGVVLANAIAALIPELVDVVHLAKANSVYAFLRSANYLVSMFATYFLIGAMGKANIFYLCSILLLPSGLICLALKRDPSRAARTPDNEEGSKDGGGGLREAVRIIRSDRHVRALTLMHLMFMPIFGAFEVMLPVFCAHRLGNADYYPLVSAGVGAGLALGSLLTYRLLGRFRPLDLVFVSFLGYSAGVFVLSRNGLLASAVAVSFAMGMVDAFGFTTYEYLKQRLVPAAYRGRVFAIMDAVVLLPLPLGYVLMGYFAERASIATLGVWLGAIALALAILSFPLTRGLPFLGDAQNGGRNRGKPEERA